MIWMLLFMALLGFISGYIVGRTQVIVATKSNNKRLITDRAELRDALATADAIGDELTATTLRQALMLTYQEVLNED